MPGVMKITFIFFKSSIVVPESTTCKNLCKAQSPKKNFVVFEMMLLAAMTGPKDPNQSHQ